MFEVAMISYQCSDSEESEWECLFLVIQPVSILKLASHLLFLPYLLFISLYHSQLLGVNLLYVLISLFLPLLLHSASIIHHLLCLMEVVVEEVEV